MSRKISCKYIQLCHGKNCAWQQCFFRNFKTGSKPSRRSITASKIKGEKEKVKNNLKKPDKYKAKKLPKKSSKCNLTRCKWKRHAVMLYIVSLSRLELIWSILWLNHQNLKKMCFWQKAPEVNGLIAQLHYILIYI